MNREFKVTLKDEAQLLRDILKDFVFEEYVNGNQSKLDRLDIKTMDNGLGYIILVINEIEDKNLIIYLINLVNSYSKQIKKVCL